MADILIKGMEMPNSCIDPKTSHGCFCLLHCKVGRQRVNEGKSLSGRPSDCPLIPVPEHGDLVQLDDALDCFSEDDVVARKALRKIPVVLERTT